MHQTISMRQDLNKSSIKQKVFAVGGQIEAGTFVVLTSFEVRFHVLFISYRVK